MPVLHPRLRAPPGAHIELIAANHMFRSALIASCRGLRRTMSTSAAAPSSSVRSTLAAAGVGIGRLNHIALAVPDLDKAVALYRDVLGANVSAPEVLRE